MNEKPKIADDIDISLVEDGYVIYQKERDKVHYLNKTAILVLESCTGNNTASDIQRIMMEAYDLPEAPEKEVTDCLNTLFEEGLIK